MEEEKMPFIDVREMALKCTSKAEVCRVLTTTAGVYLPPLDQINWDFARDILSGEKRVGFCFYFQVYRLKQGQDNWSSSLRRFTHSWHLGIRQKTLRNRPLHARVWMWKISIQEMDMKCWYGTMVLVCLVNSLIHDKFKQFVNEKVIENNRRIDDIKGNKFCVLPFMAKVFSETNFTSSKSSFDKI